MLGCCSNEWGAALEPNPFIKMLMHGVRGRRERRLRAGEFDLILDAARQNRNNYVLPTIIFAVETALRNKEILTLEQMIIHSLALFDHR